PTKRVTDASIEHSTQHTLDKVSTQRYNGVMMPATFNENGYLPQGIWESTIEEVQQRFTHTPHREDNPKGIVRIQLG
ncbi:MAG: hypothetical protein K2X81_20265, partial [Candidatus Obscuribacterales bacterium]|nr:hypothetical protein [Candidatus Obscuribacterales bacterium]